jgi:hypothetical protein
MARLEGIVARIENDLNPKVKTLFCADKVWYYDTTERKAGMSRARQETR